PAPTANQKAQQVNRDNVMIISTDPSGNLYLVDGQPVSLSMIKPMVKERAAANDKLVVSVEPDRAAPYKAMIDILDELKLAGAKRISLKTKR
ncbi:MAG TPA: biopolymer transporter ExbD, partial [Candidatus Methylomirabilis sp.]